MAQEFKNSRQQSRWGAKASAAMLGPELRFAPKKPDIKADLANATTALERAKSSGNKKAEGEASSMIAALYIKVKKYEKALEASETALACFTEVGDKDQKTSEFQRM